MLRTCPHSALRDAILGRRVVNGIFAKCSFAVFMAYEFLRAELSASISTEIFDALLGMIFYSHFVAFV